MSKQSLEMRFIQKVRRIKKAGIERNRAINSTQILEDLESLDERIRKIFDLFKNHSHKAVDVIFL